MNEIKAVTQNVTVSSYADGQINVYFHSSKHRDIYDEYINYVYDNVTNKYLGSIINQANLFVFAEQLECTLLSIEQKINDNIHIAKRKFQHPYVIHTLRKDYSNKDFESKILSLGKLYAHLDLYDNDSYDHVIHQQPTDQGKIRFNNAIIKDFKTFYIQSRLPNLSNINFSNSTFDNFNFNSGSYFNNCIFNNVKFVNCNLSNSNFDSAKFNDASFIDCKISGNIWNNTDLTNTKLDSQTLKSVKFDEYLPEKLKKLLMLL